MFQELVEWCGAHGAWCMVHGSLAFPLIVHCFATPFTLTPTQPYTPTSSRATFMLRGAPSRMMALRIRFAAARQP